MKKKRKKSCNKCRLLQDKIEDLERQNERLVQLLKETVHAVQFVFKPRAGVSDQELAGIIANARQFILSFEMLRTAKAVKS